MASIGMHGKLDEQPTVKYLSNRVEMVDGTYEP